MVGFILQPAIMPSYLAASTGFKTCLAAGDAIQDLRC